MGAQPAVGTARISQTWLERDGVLRCNNAVTIGRPNNGLLSAWTLLPAGGRSSLTLTHRGSVIDDGTSGVTPLRIAIDRARCCYSRRQSPRCRPGGDNRLDPHSSAVCPGYTTCTADAARASQGSRRCGHVHHDVSRRQLSHRAWRRARQLGCAGLRTG